MGKVQGAMDVRQKEQYVQRSRANSIWLLLLYLLKNKNYIKQKPPYFRFPFFLFPIGVTRTKISLSALMCYAMLGVTAIFGNTEVISTGQKDNTPRITGERDK